MRKLNEVILLIVACLAGLTFLFKPHLSTIERRSTQEPVTIEAVFVNMTGDSLCAKLHESSTASGDLKAVQEKPLFLSLPADLDSPEDGRLAYSDNVFELRGFRRQFETTSWLIGSVETAPSLRFDLISWKVKPPYKLWEEAELSAPDQEVGFTVESQAAGQTTKVDPGNERLFIRRNYENCTD